MCLHNPTVTLALFLVCKCASSLVAAKTYPAIQSIHVQTGDSALDITKPLALGVDSMGGLVIVDSFEREVVIGFPGNGSITGTRPVVRGTPYSQAVCAVQQVAFISYARIAIIDTVPLAVGKGTGAFDYSAAMSPFPGTFISDITISSDCATMYILDGVNRNIYIATPSSAAILLVPTAVLATLAAPTSILLSHQETHLFIADWERATIYSLSIPATPESTLHILIGDSRQHLIHDTNTTHAASLSGPTQLALFRDGLGVLFTDRNPTLGTAAVRFVRTDAQFWGEVYTLAGGNDRGSSNAADHSTLNAVWDVAYSGATGQILVSEPFTRKVRTISQIAFTWDTCPPGEYENPLSQACNACPVGFWCPGNDKKIACGGHKITPARATSPTACLCKPGYYKGPAGRCSLCPLNKYCTGLTNSSSRCPLNTVSAVGSTNAGNCSCPVGHYVDSTQTCKRCQVGSYCAGGQSTQCPLFSTSYPGSSLLEHCLCTTAYTKDSTGACRPCSGSDLCNPLVSVVETSVEVQIPASLDLSALVDTALFKQTLIDVFNLPEWVKGDDVEIIIRRTVSGVEVSVALQRRRLLYHDTHNNYLQWSAQRRVLQTPEELTQWEVITRTILGSTDPATVENYIQQMQSFVSGATGLQDALVQATSGGLATESLQIIQDSFGAAVETFEDSDTCEAEQQAVDDLFVCACNAGYTYDNEPSLPSPCVKCASNTYKTGINRKQCASCPENSQTKGTLPATAITDCKCNTGFEKAIGDSGMVCQKSTSNAVSPLMVALIVAGGVLLIGGVIVVLIWTNVFQATTAAVPKTSAGPVTSALYGVTLEKVSKAETTIDPLALQWNNTPGTRGVYLPFIQTNAYHPSHKRKTP
eukprot:2078339-Rhodomonas_salina.2